MRTFFSVSLACAVSCAQQTLEDLHALDYAPGSHGFAIDHVGEGLHLGSHHVDAPAIEHHTPTLHNLDRYYGPAHSAETGPIHHQAYTHEEAVVRAHDIELMNPDHVFHSAEQLPPMEPHAFDNRYVQHERMQAYSPPYPTYHAHGSRHAHADFDKYPGLVDRHLVPGLSERLGYRHTNSEKESEDNFLEHDLGDLHHGTIIEPSLDD